MRGQTSDQEVLDWLNYHNYKHTTAQREQARMHWVQHTPLIDSECYGWKGVRNLGTDDKGDIYVSGTKIVFSEVRQEWEFATMYTGDVLKSKEDVFNGLLMKKDHEYKIVRPHDMKETNDTIYVKDELGEISEFPKNFFYEPEGRPLEEEEEKLLRALLEQVQFDAIDERVASAKVYGRCECTSNGDEGCRSFFLTPKKDFYSQRIAAINEDMVSIISHDQANSEQKQLLSDLADYYGIEGPVKTAALQRTSEIKDTLVPYDIMGVL